MMDTYLRSKELVEIAAVLDALNGPLLDNISIEGPVTLKDVNGETAGYIKYDKDEGYIFVADAEFNV